MELTEKQVFWKAHIDAAAEFEGSQVAYVRRHGLGIKRYYYYKRRLRDKGALSSAVANDFVRVTHASTADSTAQVMLPNGVRLLLPDLSQPGLLERLASL